MGDDARESVNRGCETDDCHRDTEWVVHYPIAGSDTNRSRAMCNPCKTVFLQAAGRLPNEITLDSYSRPDTVSGGDTTDG